MENKIKVMIVDDTDLIRLGLREGLSSKPEIEVVAEADSAEDAIEQYAETMPDVVTVDYRMPGQDGIELVQYLRSKYADAKIIMLSIYEGEDIVIRAIRAGVKGYVSKDCSVEVLRDAVMEVSAGRDYFQASIANVVSQHSEDEELTARELEVLNLVVEGISNREVAQELSISVATVKLHMTSILRKFSVSDRTQLVLEAIRKGFVKMDV